jgi:hypothetical protein
MSEIPCLVTLQKSLFTAFRIQRRRPPRALSECHGSDA